MYTKEWSDGGIGPAGYYVLQDGNTIGAFWHKEDQAKAIDSNNAMAGVPDPAAFMAAVDAVLVSYDYIMKYGPTLEKGDLGIQLDRLKAARGKH